MSGKKRSSPGADEEKEPVQSVTLNDEDAQKLEGVQNRVRRVELLIGMCPDIVLSPMWGDNTCSKTATVRRSCSLFTSSVAR